MTVKEDPMATIVRIDENVKYLRQSFEEHQTAFKEHTQKDERIINEFVRPLWEKSLQAEGAEKTRNKGSVFIGYALNAGIAVTAAWAAVKGLKS